MDPSARSTLGDKRADPGKGSLGRSRVDLDRLKVPIGRLRDQMLPSDRGILIEVCAGVDDAWNNAFSLIIDDL